jgi:hypothetical protein
MDSKSLRLLIVLFFLLLGVVVFPLLPSTFIPNKRNSEIVLTQYTKDSSNRIIISDAMSEITLDRDGTSWKIASYSASTQTIERFFENISQTSMGTLVSNNPANASDYGVSSQSAIRLTLQNSSTKTTVLVGKSGASADSYYVQKEGSTNIYMMNGGLKDTLSTKVSDWRDRSIVHLSSDQIQNIEVQGLNPFIVQKNVEGKWEVKNGTGTKTIEENNIREIIGTVSTLTASSFYTEEEATQLQQSKDKRIVMVRDKDGKSLITMTIIPDNAYYLVLVQGRSDLYKIAGYNLDNFFQLSS